MRALCLYSPPQLRQPPLQTRPLTLHVTLPLQASPSSTSTWWRSAARCCAAAAAAALASSRRREGGGSPVAKQLQHWRRVATACSNCGQAACCERSTQCCLVQCGTEVAPYCKQPVALQHSSMAAGCARRRRTLGGSTSAAGGLWRKRGLVRSGNVQLLQAKLTNEGSKEDSASRHELKADAPKPIAAAWHPDGDHRRRGLVWRLRPARGPGRGRGALREVSRATAELDRMLLHVCSAISTDRDRRLLRRSSARAVAAAAAPSQWRQKVRLGRCFPGFQAEQCPARAHAEHHDLHLITCCRGCA